MKRRVGTAHGFNPNPEYVRQLDDYLAQSQQAGKGVRMGVLTDGRHWLLRWPNAGPVTTTAPYAFVLDSPERWFLLYEWLRDEALVSLDEIRPDREAISAHFGPNSPSYRRDLAALKTLYQSCAGYQTIQIKRQLWHDLLRTALGEIARTPEQMDDLFIRHTYLTAVIGMVVQASFGIDIRRMAATNPADLLIGRQFRSDDRPAGRRRVRLLRLADRGRRPAPAQDPGPSRRPVRLAQRPGRHRRHPLRDRHLAGGAPAAWRVLHARLAGPGHGAVSW